MSLEDALTALRAANRVSGSRASYRKDNPSEYDKVMAYLDGAPRPTGVKTELGRGLLLVEDERRIAAPLPPTGQTWDAMLAREFPITPFTPDRTLTASTPTELLNAWVALRAGDKLTVRPFTFSGQQFEMRDKRLPSWAEIHFEAGVRFIGGPERTDAGIVGQGNDKIRLFGGDVSAKGYGVRYFDNVDWEHFGFKAHDCGATGLQLCPSDPSRASYRSPERNRIVFESWNCGLDHTHDPHAEKGTGLHAGYYGKSGVVPTKTPKIAAFTHDQPRCAGGVQFVNVEDYFFAVLAKRLPFRATSQTAGNALQTFGNGGQRGRLWIEAEDITGKGFASIVGGTGLASNVVEYGRAVRYGLNPHEGGVAWDTNGGIQYEDVQPQDFGP